MRILVLSIGDELLLGDTINTNAASFGRFLVEEGLRLTQEQAIGDDALVIYQALQDAWGHWDVVITTGGLGPTHDDRTLDVLSRFCEEHNLPMMEYDNAFGVEKGVFVEGEKTWLMALPGVPYEAEGMFKTIVLPKILDEPHQERTLPPRFVLTAGERERDLANEFIGDWSHFEQKGCTLAYLPGAANVKLRIGMDPTPELTETEAVGLLDEFEGFVRGCVAFCTYGLKATDTLPKAVLGLCREKGWRLGAAESCTGGMIGAALTDPAGASDVFMGSLVTYSNEAKVSQLGVNEQTLATYGAVSKQTVIEMAEGVRKALGVELGCSVSGVAGPGGGSDEKPVGTIWFGLSTPNESFAWTTQVAHTRELNRSRSVILTLEAIRRTLVGEARLPRGVHKQV
ncbi:MAG: nicotinamide-nucleotide amidohydrolase family protein [Balneolaceae bacterium]|nr:nicotinamide-nucleotide amidohydrolase family protein [Balneolaceae bacterium]MDR9446316.1 nicotinamide-nucleotide amidohydrolase family protein [Balneolaceae bacterium]